MKEWRTASLFLLPSAVGLLVFFALPMLDTVQRSFMNDAGTAFSGFGNYAEVVQNEAFRLATFNTLKFMGICVPLLLVVSLALAIFLSKLTPFRKVMRSVLLLPLAIPTFTAAVLVSVTFDSSGLLNGILGAFGLPGFSWLDSDLVFWVLVGDYLWKNIGYCVVLWLAALSCVPRELLEAALVDGASRWQRFVRVTLPLLRPSLAVVAILAIINGFKIYREAYLVAGSYPPDSIYLIPHLFNNWFSAFSLGKLSAASVILSLALSAAVAALVIAWQRSGGHQ